MKNDHWEKVKGIFLTLKNLAPELRLSYLEEVCANDGDTRREVESLLASHDEAEGFMETPAVGEVADVIHQTKNLGKGNRLGHYEIIEQIGAGGMGEVYLAQDTKLGRKVAVKILNESFAKHESNLNRFIQEAKAASALNHPNILVIYEVSEDKNTNYIVSEFIKGQTLSEVIRENSLKLTDVLKISTQIASALCAAHEAHLVHRDIKPENVMVSQDGIVKVLDFGLAKLIKQNAVGFEETTIIDNQTAKGIILGTVNYMSPEQAKGEKLDARTDIFSFGTVLSEMLTGQHPFRGETINHTIVAILEKEPPPLSLFIKDFPTEIERIIKKCLEKDLQARYGSAKELLADLKALEKRLEFEIELERASAPNKKTAAKTHIFKGVVNVETTSLPPSPTLPSLPPLPNNLPENAEPLIGREKEIAEIKDLLQQTNVRLVTLTGIGGAGKTRLAQSVARDLLRDFPDGVFFVELAAVTSPELVASAVAQPLGVKEAGGKSILEILKDYLSDKKILLVIDNFEQVIDAAPQIGDLLAESRLKILITSRTLLRLSAEREFVVPPLAVPAEISEVPIETLAGYDAIKLFVQRGQKAKPAFVLTEENAASVAEICTRLDGLPLAIELAAARVKILAPQVILAKLDNSLRLLTGGARDLPARQQTMRGMVEWSYGLLTEAEKGLFRQLAVFAGGFRYEAAEAVCTNDESTKGQTDFLDLLTSLADKSLLVTKEQSESGESRFWMLEVVREYAFEVLETHNQADKMRRCHSLYFLEFAEKADPHLQTVQANQWFSRLEEEHDNLRAALTWSFESEPKIAARLAGALRLLWNLHGHLTEGRFWLQKALDSTVDISLETKWKILLGIGLIANLQGDYESGQNYLEKCRATAILANNRQKIALSGKFLSWTLRELGNHSAAKSLIEESLAIGRELNDKDVIGQSLLSLGELERSKDNYVQARGYYEESLEFFEQIDKKNGIVISLINLGAVTYLQNDFQTAHSYYEKALGISQKLGYKMVLSYCFDGFAALNFKRNDFEAAVKLSATAEKLRKSIGFVIEREERRFRDAYVAELKTKMDKADFSKLYEQGWKLKLEESIALIADLDYQADSISNI
jgi:non-specific serine/threonine protein kinase